MILAVDVGNTNIEFGIYLDNELKHTFRLTTKPQTSDEFGLTISEYFSRFNLVTTEVEAVLIASVVPAIMHSLKASMVKYLNVKPLVVNEDIFPVLGYLGKATTNDHGADRSVACMAAVEKYGAPLLVLDFGTATTVDAVDRNNVYVGGSICLGIRGSMNALASNAAMLPHVNLDFPNTFLGYDTITQIQSGIVGGYIGSMDYLIHRTKDEMEEPNDEIKVIATGGLSTLISKFSNEIDIVDSELILDGLVSIYQKYIEKQ